MGIPVSIRDIIIGANAAGGPDFDLIQNSLRFRGGQYLSRTFTTDGSSQLYSVSVWVKVSTGNLELLSATSDSFNLDLVRVSSNYQVNNYVEQGGSDKSSWTTTSYFRDSSAWYHVFVAKDCTQGGVSNYFKLWINGVQQTTTWSQAGAQYPAIYNYINRQRTHYIGRDVYNGT